MPRRIIHNGWNKRVLEGRFQKNDDFNKDLIHSQITMVQTYSYKYMSPKPDNYRPIHTEKGNRHISYS